MALAKLVEELNPIVASSVADSRTAIAKGFNIIISPAMKYV
jgi:hypothetical protein